jgi:hypothetical protein
MKLVENIPSKNIKRERERERELIVSGSSRARRHCNPGTEFLVSLTKNT